MTSNEINLTDPTTPTTWERRQIEDAAERQGENYGYPAGWPNCPSCGRPALDGHITCGNANCEEGTWR